jgi:hypothetical protein
VVEKPNKFQPALIGGIILGLLSAIPFVNLGNCFCCLWVVLGGAIAARILIKRSPLPITTGEGAIVGALAGVVGAVVSLVIGLPLSLLLPDLQIMMLNWFANMTNDPNVREQIRQAIEQSETQDIGQRFISGIFFWFIGAFFTIAFATLGGIIGVAMFEKRKGQEPPAGPMGYPPQGPPPGYAPPGPPPGPQSPY